MKRLLVTGADGYIAQHLLRALKEWGYEVISGTRNGDSGLWMDFSEPTLISDLKVSNIDTMIHTVSPNEGLYKADIYRAIKENSAGIYAALEFCVRNRIPNFIYLSSFHVFGASSGKLTEAVLPAPANVYGLSHWVSEQTVQMFDRTGKVNAWILRLSNVFGVPVDGSTFKRWNLIPFAFCKEAVEHKRITLMTPGHQLRNFVGVQDVLRRLLWIIDKRPSERLVHAYGNDTLSIHQYALLVQRVAREKFHWPVQVVRPEGVNNSVDFEYSSLYGNEAPAPEEKIEQFVAEMLEVLYSDKEGRSI